MTTQQAKTIRTIEAQHEAQRFAAEQVAREQSAQRLRDAALERAGELALAGRLAESRRVIELNFFANID